MQCRWRAGAIKELPEIKWTFDFTESIGPILDYDALPDITTDDVEEYIWFLESTQGEVWLNYGLSEHHTIHGNIGLLSLPDIRDEEEKRLMKLVVCYSISLSSYRKSYRWSTKNI